MGIMRVLNKDILEVVQEVKNAVQLQQQEIENIKKESKERQIILEEQVKNAVNNIIEFNSAQKEEIANEIVQINEQVKQVLEEVTADNKTNRDNALALKAILQDIKEMNIKYEEKIENEFEKVIAKIDDSKRENNRAIEDGTKKVQKEMKANKKELKDIKDTVIEMEEGCLLNLVNSLLDDI